MFGLFKRRPVQSGPITFDFDILIERPVEEVYPLIDWADPRNAKRQLGHKVEGDGSRLVLTMAEMPEHRFNFDITEAKPNEVYAYSCDIQPRVGRLAHGHESYSFERTEEGHCLLRLVNTVQFVDGLSKRELEHEMMVMSVATSDALAKLKIMAELGFDAAKAVENASFVGS